MFFLRYICIVFVLLELVLGYGEPDTNGLPSWMERSNFALMNAVRIAPSEYLRFYTPYAPLGILSPDVYPSVPPLYMEPALFRSADFHSLDMADNGCFSHPSCDGTDTFDRIGSFYQCSPLATENIAAGFNSPLFTNNQWICDDASGDPFSSSCASDGGGDGHRKNIMNPDSKVAGVGYGFSMGQDLHFFWTQDFGNEPCSPISSPIHSGSHIFVATFIQFMVDWYNDKQVEPISAHVIIQGEAYPLKLRMGTKDKGVWVYQSRMPRLLQKSCRDYYFLFQAKLNSNETETFRYPDTGYLSTFGEGRCLQSFTLEGTEYKNTTGESSTGSATPVPSSSSTGFVSTTGVIPTPSESEEEETSESTDVDVDQESIGCYVDGIAHDLSAMARFDRNLTNEKCRQFCSKTLYKYSATSMGNTCFCGNSYGYYGLAKNQSECSYRCGGNKTEYCGGNMKISVSHSSYMGCYSTKEVISYFDIAYKSSANMSVNSCKSFCSTTNYQFSALAKGSYCLCGNQEVPQKLEHSGSECSVPCSKYDICGGEQSLSVYTNQYGTNTQDKSTDFTNDPSIFTDYKSPSSSSSSLTILNYSILVLLIIVILFN